MPQARDIDDLRRILRQHLPVLRERYAVESLGLFGSYVRGEADAESDLDLLVQFRQAPGLIRIVELENLLSSTFALFHRRRVGKNDPQKPPISIEAAARRTRIPAR